MKDEDNPDLFPEGDEYWERMERQLDETEYDTELGMEMAKDARRLVAGEITETEFYEQYHEKVVEEFEGDNRGLNQLLEDNDVDVADDASIGDRLKALTEKEEFDRREVMKAGGAAALALGVGASGADNQPSSKGPTDTTAGGGHGTQWGMVINLNNCDGCLECVVACKGLHGTSEGAHWLYVMAYEDADQDGESFLVRPCMHCDEAPCEKVCPVGARHTREKDGLVLSDYEICIGCRYCMVSCPYGANYFQWGEPTKDPDSMDQNFTHDERGKWVDGPPPKGVMGKCSFEPAWQDGKMGESLVGTTMCESACTRDAIHFGDMNDPESAPNKHLEEYKQQQQNDLSEFEDRKDHTVSTFQLRENLGTDPNVLFIGDEPSPHAKQVDPNDSEKMPVTYEEMGLVSNRTEEILDKGAAANDSGGDEK